ncbi:hypothetical protein BDV59DRAFT_189777 [Aspergillus ambiguus]|uniref:uncharacterized protein n=1 Tax=Aspergillus ambiguus TaxID=176160 RepID=UPI003CCDD112
MMGWPHELEDELFNGDKNLVGKRDETQIRERGVKPLERALNWLIATSQVRALRLESQINIITQRLD